MDQALQPPCPEQLLQCPISGQPLAWLDDVALRSLRRELDAGKLRHHDGSSLGRPVEAALATPDGRWTYGVREDILYLLPELALIGDKLPPGPALRAEKRRVQQYYDAVGWTLDERGVFVDSRRYEDPRSVAAEYFGEAHERLRQRLSAGGTFLLDVGSGPVAYPEYYAHGQAFTWRICVDLSLAALQAARRNLGRRGIYILADASRLPLRDASVDAAVCLHTISQLPADEQPNAFRELVRVVRPEGLALVVDAWWSCLATVVDLPASLLRRWRETRDQPAERWAGAPGGQLPEPLRTLASRPPVYRRTRGWFQRQAWPFDYELHCWRTLPDSLVRLLMHRSLGGRRLLRLLSRWERDCPERAARSAAQTLIVLRGGQPDPSRTDPQNRQSPPQLTSLQGR